MATAGEVADNRPSEHEVTNAIRDLTVKETKKLVHKLGVKLTDIDDIDGFDLLKEHLVKKWLDMDTSASWKKLVSALRDIKNNNLADDIERSHARAAIISSTSSDRASDSGVRHGHAASLAQSSIDENDFDIRGRILLCGDSKVGKTSLISQFTKGRLEDANTTLDVKWKVKLFCIGGDVVRMEILDTPGDEASMPLTVKHFKEAQGILVMYDITNEKSFENVAKWMNNIGRNTVPIALVGNKIDLEEQRKISRKEGERLAEKFGVRFFETSALRDQCVKEPFKSLHVQNLQRMVINAQTDQHQRKAEAVIKLEDRESSSGRDTRNKWCCCC